jgi:hypothetical protein
MLLGESSVGSLFSRQISPSFSRCHSPFLLCLNLINFSLSYCYKTFFLTLLSCFSTRFPASRHLLLPPPPAISPAAPPVRRDRRVNHLFPGARSPFPRLRKKLGLPSLLRSRYRRTRAGPATMRGGQGRRPPVTQRLACRGRR